MTKLLSIFGLFCLLLLIYDVVEATNESTNHGEQHAPAVAGHSINIHAQSSAVGGNLLRGGLSPVSNVDNNEATRRTTEGPYYILKNHTGTNQIYADVSDTVEGLEGSGTVTKVVCHLLSPGQIHSIISCKNAKIHLQIQASIRATDGKIIYMDAFGKEKSIIQDTGAAHTTNAAASSTTGQQSDPGSADVVPDQMQDEDTNFYYFISNNTWIIFVASFALVSIIIFFTFCTCCCCIDDDDDSDDEDEYNDEKSAASTKSSGMEEIWSYGRRASNDFCDHSANLHDIDLSLVDTFDRLNEETGRIQEVKQQQQNKYISVPRRLS